MNVKELRSIINEEISKVYEVKLTEPVRRGDDVYIGSDKLDYLGTINKLDAYVTKYNTIYIFNGKQCIALTNQDIDNVEKMMKNGANYIKQLVQKQIKKGIGSKTQKSTSSGYDNLIKALSNTNEELLREEEQTEKTFPSGPTLFNGKKSKWKSYWEFDLLPVTFEIAYNFQLKSNSKTIIDEFGKKGDSLRDTNKRFFYAWVRKNWSAGFMFKKLKMLKLPQFYITNVLFENDFDEKSLNFLDKRMVDGSGQKYKIIVTLEAKNDSKQITKPDFERLIKDMAPFIEDSLLSDTPYFTFYKK